MENIKFRPLQEEDRHWFASVLALPEVIRFLPFGVHSTHEANERFDRYLQLSSTGEGYGVFVYTHPESDEQMAYGLIRPFEWQDGLSGVEGAIVIAPKFWRQGVGTFMAKNLFSKILKSFPEAPVYAIIHEDNLGSQAAAKMCNLKKVAPSEQYPGQWIWEYNKSNTPEP